MLRWLRSWCRGRTNQRANRGGVVVGRDNLGPIITGHVDHLQISTPLSRLDDERVEIAEEELLAAARTLISAIRKQLPFSSVVVPVGLELLPSEPNAQALQTSLSELLEKSLAGESLLLFGEGGIGKTTAALELADRILDTAGSHIPVFVDTATWSASGLGLLEYICSLPCFLASSITPTHLARYLVNGRLVLFVNGWNEVPLSAQQSCAHKLRQTLGAPAPFSIVLTARSSFENAGLSRVTRIKVTGLAWAHQKDFIQRHLNPERASLLIDKLAKRDDLRFAARNPLILAGIVRLSEQETHLEPTTYDIFAAIVAHYESEGPRSAALRAAPVFGIHTYYLEAIALEMNRLQGTTLSVANARSCLGRAAQAALAEGTLSQPPSIPELLQALCDYHLLHLDGEFVRFVHQRFQEYYAASMLLRLWRRVADANLLRDPRILEALNWPFWEDALLLALEKISSQGAGRQIAVGIVDAAHQLDLGFACELAGQIALQREEAATLYDALADDVSNLKASPILEVSEYATACLISSRLEDLVPLIWPLLESADDQVRLKTYHSARALLSVRQFGPSGLHRIMRWPEERRIEFVRHIGHNADNAAYLAETATTDPSGAVRAAALAAIAWELPGSDLALRIWRASSDQVRLDRDVLAGLGRVISDPDDALREELEALFWRATSDGERLRLAKYFPGILGKYVVKMALEELKEADDPHVEPNFLRSIQEAGPEEVKDIASDLCLTRWRAPEWARNVVAALSASERAAIFARGWQDILRGLPDRLDFQVVGGCADLENVRVAVREYLRLRDALSSTIPRDEELRAQMDAVCQLLSNVRGGDLVSAVAELGGAANYDAGACLLDLVFRRAGGDVVSERDGNAWIPQTSEMDRLFDCFFNKEDPYDPPQNAIRNTLCLLASRVDAQRYRAQILEACRRELDSWKRFGQLVNAREKDRRAKDRPINPHNGRMVVQALIAIGFPALPELLELMRNPWSGHVVLPAIVGIVSSPWANRRPRTHWSPAIDGKEGRRRRLLGLCMLQPEPAVQPATDEAAKCVVERIRFDLAEMDQETLQLSDDRRRGSWVRAHLGQSVEALAAMPSREGLEPLRNTLAGPEIGDEVFLDALGRLVRQGAMIDSPAVVRRLLTIRDAAAATSWMNESERFRFTRINSLLYFVAPTSLLEKGLTEYLDDWVRVAGVGDVVRGLRTIGIEEAWRSLAHLARNLDHHRRNLGEDLAYAVAEELSAGVFKEFLEMVRDRTFFNLSNSHWTFQRVAPHVAKLVSSNAAMRDDLIAACKEAGTVYAENFVLHILASIEGAAPAVVELCLEALDNATAGAAASPAVATIPKLFTTSEPLGDSGAYEIHPRSNNALRRELFLRALGTGAARNQAKALLCEIEMGRRETGRPSDEPRHPDIDSGGAWTDALR